MYRLNISSHHPQICMLSPKPHCGGIWRQGILEVIRFRRGPDGGPHDEINVLIGDVTELSLSLTPSLALSLSLPLHHIFYVKIERKVALCKPGRESSLEHRHAGTLILDYQTPELFQSSENSLS